MIFHSRRKSQYLLFLSIELKGKANNKDSSKSFQRNQGNVSQKPIGLYVESKLFLYTDLPRASSPALVKWQRLKESLFYHSSDHLGYGIHSDHLSYVWGGRVERKGT